MKSNENGLFKSKVTPFIKTGVYVGLEEIIVPGSGKFSVSWARTGTEKVTAKTMFNQAGNK